MSSEADMLALARSVRDQVCRPGLVTLAGDLGAGKTTLVRGLLRAMGYAGPVKSPTFTLVESYDTEAGEVIHSDLYRLEDPLELDNLGYRDWFAGDAVVFIEWPERARGMLPAANKVITIEIAGQDRLVDIDDS